MLLLSCSTQSFQSCNLTFLEFPSTWISNSSSIYLCIGNCFPNCASAVGCCNGSGTSVPHPVRLHSQCMAMRQIAISTHGACAHMYGGPPPRTTIPANHLLTSPPVVASTSNKHSRPLCRRYPTHGRPHPTSCLTSRGLWTMWAYFMKLVRRTANSIDRGRLWGDAR